VSESEPELEPEIEAEAEVVVEPESVEEPAQKPRSGGAASALALLVALAALGLSGWQYYQSQLVSTDTEDPLRDQLQAQLSDTEARLRSSQAEGLQDFSETQQALRQQLAQQKSAAQAQYDQLATMLQSQRQRLLELGSADRDDWMLAEAEYLLRLANQRLIMAADVRSALALLSSADGILKEMDDPELHPVRLKIAADLAALRAVPELDVEGTWMRIQALVGQLEALTLFRLPVVESAEQEALPEAADWDQRLQSGVDAALARLSNYVVVRRRQTPYEALIDPQWEGMVRQNLRMLLEQARAALLSGNQALYSQSISNARRWLGEFFSFNEAGVQAMEAELAALEQVTVSRNYPDISGSISAVKTAIRSKHRIESGQ
jgi:uroporphyrin-3 C-methyltransferase